MQSQPTVIVPEDRFLEGLWLVILHPVERADHVGVSIFLVTPLGAVPMLAVSAVARGQLVALQLSNLEHFGVVELNGVITGAPVILSEQFGAQIAISERSGLVVAWATV
jgi:hypothetical protein